MACGKDKDQIDVASALRTVEERRPLSAAVMNGSRDHHRASWTCGIWFARRSRDRMWTGWEEGSSVKQNHRSGSIAVCLAKGQGVMAEGTCYAWKLRLGPASGVVDVWPWMLNITRCVWRIWIYYSSLREIKSSGYGQSLKPQCHCFPCWLLKTLLSSSWLTWKIKRTIAPSS